MSIIAARLQGNNEMSSFISDVYEVARLVECNLKCATFINFATDSILVEIYNILLTLYQFLDGKINHYTAVDNKHNIKNDRYQFVEGSNAVFIKEAMILNNMLTISKVYKIS